MLSIIICLKAMLLLNFPFGNSQFALLYSIADYNRSLDTDCEISIIPKLFQVYVLTCFKMKEAPLLAVAYLAVHMLQFLCNGQSKLAAYACYQCICNCTVWGQAIAQHMETSACSAIILALLSMKA